MQERRTTRTATNVRKERTFRSGPYLEGLFGASRVDAYLQAEICARIKQARKEAGLSQEDMAGLLNLTTRAYQNYESVRVPFRRMGDIAKLTNTDERWLLHGNPPPPPLSDVGVAQLLERVGGMESSLEDVRAMVQELLRARPASEPG